MSGTSETILSHATQEKLFVMLPAFNEASRLNGDPFKGCLDSYIEFFSSEIPSDQLKMIVIDDGSTDNTSEVAKQYGWDVTVHDRNQGKGAALRTGSRAAMDSLPSVSSDEIIMAFADADGSTKAKDVFKLVELIASGAEIAMAKRRMDRRTKVWRDLGHSLAQELFKVVIPTGVSDPQAGAMALTGSAIDIWTDEVAMNGYAATAEALHIANNRGLKVVERETPMTAVDESHVTAVDGFRLVRDAFRIKLNDYSRANQHIQSLK